MRKKKGWRVRAREAGRGRVCASLVDDGTACPPRPRRSVDDRLPQNTASLPFYEQLHVAQLFTVSLARRGESVGKRAMVIAQIQHSTHHLRDVVRRVLGLSEGHQPADKGWQ